MRKGEKKRKTAAGHKDAVACRKFLIAAARIAN
jgi:hypothetical protein